MHIFVSDISEQLKSGASASHLVRLLLDFACKKVWNMPCPAIAKTSAGKPYFPDYPDLHFSLSHSKTKVLVALSDHDIGADIEDTRPIPDALPNRLFTAEEQTQFDFFEAWTLREAVFKLKNEDWLMDMRLSKQDGEIVTPYPNVRCCSFFDLPDSTISVACENGSFPSKIEIISPTAFLP